jgi:hypothetical protein
MPLLKWPMTTSTTRTHLGKCISIIMSSDDASNRNGLFVDCFRASGVCRAVASVLKHHRGPNAPLVLEPALRAVTQLCKKREEIKRVRCIGQFLGPNFSGTW